MRGVSGARMCVCDTSGMFVCTFVKYHVLGVSE